jgi:hypothetical protein
VRRGGGEGQVEVCTADGQEVGGGEDLDGVEGVGETCGVLNAGKLVGAHVPRRLPSRCSDQAL